MGVIYNVLWDGFDVGEDEVEDEVEDVMVVR